MMIFPQEVNAILVGGMDTMLEIVLKEDRIQKGIIIVKEDIEAVREVITIIIEEDIDLQDHQVEGVQEKEVQKNIREEEAIVEEVEVEVGVEVVYIENLEVEAAEKRVKILEIMMIINLGVKKAEAKIIIMIVIIILL